MEKNELDKTAMFESYKHANPHGDEPCYDKDFYEGFIKGTEWLMGQPLKDRMDEEEWEEYIELKRCANYVYHWGTSPVECKKCGNLNPSGCICASCGWDNTYDPNEDE